MKKIIIVLSAIVIIASSCKTTSINSEENEEVVYEISVGETLEIKLAANPTTGYSWNWANEESITIVDSSGYRYALDEPVMAGSGGNDVWSFVGVKAGQETIVFEYARSWERQNVADVKRFVVSVK
jgi:inhibitor of cysteine peptidase